MAAKQNQPSAHDPHEEDHERLGRLEYEYGMLQQEGAELQKQLQMVNQLNAENEAALKALSALKDMNDSLMPIGSGVFAKIKVTDSQKVFVEVGARVIAERSAGDATKILGQKKTDLEKALKELQQNLGAVGQRLAEVQNMAAEIEAGHKH